MKTKLIIIGAGSHSKSVITILKNSKEFTISGILDWSESFNPDEVICGVSVVGLANKENTIIIDELLKEHNFFIAVGDNAKRKHIFNILHSKGASLISAISNTAIIADDFFVSESTMVGLGVIINSNVSIKQNSIINSGAIVEHDVKVGSNTHIGPNSVLCGSSNIGSNVLVGAGSVVLPKVNIADNIIIGAGSVVTGDLCNNNSVYIGSPAKLRK